MPAPAPARRQAIRILEASHRQVMALVDGLPRRAITTAGIGGGEWSAKDLVGHLALWEGFAVEALASWDRGQAWPGDARLRRLGIDDLNREGLDRTRRLSAPQVRRHADATHQELVGQLRSMGDERWRERATPRSRRSLGERLGSILGGPAGPFRHDEAHLPDLESFVRTIGAERA